MRWAVAGIILGLTACATVMPPADPAALYADGKIAEANQAMTAAPVADKQGTLRCRLALLNNHVTESLNCLNALKSPPSKLALTLRAEAERRKGDFAAASQTFKQLGDQDHAEQFAYLASHPPSDPDDGNTHVVKFLQTDPLPVLEASVASLPACRFVLDTGAGDTVLSPALAKQAHAVLFGSSSGTFAGGKQAAIGQGVVDRFQIGDLTLRNMPIKVLDVSNMDGETGGTHICGIIGVGFLSQFRATIDYPGGRLVLASRNSLSAMGGKTVRMWLAGDHYILANGRINHGPSQLFIVDTGLSGGGFLAPDSVLAAAGLKPSGAHITGQGGGGAVQAQPFVVKTVALGSVAQYNVTGFQGVFPPPLEHQFGTHISGLVSHQFLRSYAVTFDFRRMVIMLRS